ncbi:UNVERIFIED_CONTAM: hypothetical protein K2H54_024811 [Gekko kuhli]
MSQSLRRKIASRAEEERTVAQTPSQGTLDLFPLDEETPADRARKEGEACEDPEVQTENVGHDLEDSDETQLDFLDEPETMAASPGGNPSDTNERDPETIPLGSAMVDLSPASRMALKKARKKRVSALNRVGDLMIRHSARDHRNMIEHDDRQHGELLAEMCAAREEVRNQSQAICSLFRETMAAIVGMAASTMRAPEGTPAPPPQCMAERTLPNLSTGVVLSADVIDTVELENGGAVEIHALLDMEEPNREQWPLLIISIPQSPVAGPPLEETRPKRVIKKRYTPLVLLKKGILPW